MKRVVSNPIQVKDRVMVMIQEFTRRRIVWIILVLAFMPTVAVNGFQEKALQSKADPQISAKKQKLYELFEKKMTNVKFTGNFTTIGKQQDNLPKESYTIVSVKKLDEGELWLFTARVRFGGQDVTLPLPLEVQWAGTTPVITLTKVLIPGLGTFSSRVVIYKNKYAGTWTHGDVGGHLFGTIGPNTDANPKGDSSDSPSK